MKRFRFALQPLNTVRSWRESAAREGFAAAVRTLAAADDAVRQAQARLAEIEQLVRAGRRATFRPGEQAAFLAAYQHEQTQVARAEQVRRDAQAALDRARAAWQLARNDLRVVEQLKDRARHAHRVEQERAEQGALDELASLRATRPSPALA